MAHKEGVNDMMEYIYRLKDEMEYAIEYGTYLDTVKTYQKLSGIESVLTRIDGYDKEFLKVHGLLEFYKPEHREAIQNLKNVV